MTFLFASPQRRLVESLARRGLKTAGTGIGGLERAQASALVPSRGGRCLFFSTRVQEAETFLNGTSSLYAEQMYEQYLQDPSSVHESWQKYFQNVEGGVAFDAGDYSRPTSIPGKRALAATVVSCVCAGRGGWGGASLDLLMPPAAAIIIKSSMVFLVSC